MNSVLFDSVELISSIYNVSKVLDNTTPARSINLIETEGVNGAVIISDRFGTKKIEIRGILIGSSEADLQTKIDTANELFSRKDVDLDMTPDGGIVRRYVVRLTGAIEYNRNFYNTNYVPFRVKFLVPEGVGKDTSSTTALSHLNTTQERDPTPSGSDTISLLGSADPKPDITFTLDLVGKLDLITINDDDSGEEMSIEIDSSYSNGDIVVVNLENQTVEKDGVSVPYLGKLPEFLKGNNDLHITYQGATYVLDQEQTGRNRALVVGNSGVVTHSICQSFIPSQSGYLSRLKIWASKTGTPGSLQIRVYSDNGGLPFENLISGAGGLLEPESSFGGGAEVTIDDSTPDYYLRKGVKYWLVFTTTNSSGNYYNIFGTDSDNYSDGIALFYDGAVTPPTDPADWAEITGAGAIADFYFKTHQGQGTPADWLVDYVIRYIKRYL